MTGPVAEKKIRTGILGGTFDPIHRGHIAMALYAAEDFDLSEVWIMPNGAPPHKENSHVNATPEERLIMTQLAIKDAQEQESKGAVLRACDYEVRRDEKSYSYETMETFRAIYPDREFFFIIGEDSLLDLTKWKEPARLLAACTMLVAVRYDSADLLIRDKVKEYKEIFDPCDIEILSMPRIDVSSTEIRAKLAGGMSVADLVTPSVDSYIKDHPGIYGNCRESGAS